MFDDFLHQLDSGSLPSERCRMEGTRDEAHDRVQLHIDLTCVSRLERSTLLLNSKAPEQMTAEY